MDKRKWIVNVKDCHNVGLIWKQSVGELFNITEYYLSKTLHLWTANSEFFLCCRCSTYGSDVNASPFELIDSFVWIGTGGGAGNEYYFRTGYVQITSTTQTLMQAPLYWNKQTKKINKQTNETNKQTKQAINQNKTEHKTSKAKHSKQ